MYVHIKTFNFFKSDDIASNRCRSVDASDEGRRQKTGELSKLAVFKSFRGLRSGGSSRSAGPRRAEWVTGNIGKRDRARPRSGMLSRRTICGNGLEHSICQKRDVVFLLPCPPSFSNYLAMLKFHAVEGASPRPTRTD